MGNLLGHLGHYEEAERIIEEGIIHARQMKQVWELARGLNKLWMVYFYSGRFDEALIPNTEYLALSEEHGFTWGVVISKIAQGQFYLHLGRYSEAREQGESAAQQAQNDNYSCEALILLTQANIAMGEIETARKHLEQCTRLCPSRLVGTELYVAGNELYLSLLAVIDRKTAVAWGHLQTELTAALDCKNILALSTAIAMAAYLKAIGGQGVSALELYSLAQQHPFIANSEWFEDVIGREIELATQSLEQETVRAASLQGKALDIFEQATELIAEIRTAAFHEE